MQRPSGIPHVVGRLSQLVLQRRGGSFTQASMVYLLSLQCWQRTGNAAGDSIRPGGWPSGARSSAFRLPSVWARCFWHRFQPGTALA
eukprot:10932704-Karenia_brevis.AAC.1